MIELLLTVCLAADPASCRDTSLTFDGEGLTKMQCLMSAPAMVARWADDHPKWTVTRWACQPAGLAAKI